MKKILVLFLVVFMSFAGAVLAQETTTTVLEKNISMPFTFRVNKLFLEFRKMITFDPVSKAKIENTIIEKEESVINKMLENDKIKVDNEIVSNFIVRRENALNKLNELKNKGKNVSDLIQRIENNTVDQNSILYKRLEVATDDQKGKIVDNLIKKQETIQNRIQIKETILEDKNTEDNIRNSNNGITLKSEEQNSLLDDLINTVKDKVVLLTQNQKNHFINYLKLKIFKLKDEGIDILKEKLEDGSIKFELYSVMDKIINYNRPVVSIEKQEKIQEKNQEKNGSLEIKNKKELNKDGINSNKNMNQLNNKKEILKPAQQKGLNN